MQPKYGCDLKKFVFEQIDATLISELNDEIAHAILHFEPRVKFIEAEVIEKNELEGIASLLIKYEIIITNTRHNIVFPFYKLEGTNIDNALL
jgi:phage baseplate assembly protein W